MEEPGGSVSIDMEMIPFGGKEFMVETSRGPVSVCVCGDPVMPALITYPDVALDYMSCFQGLLFCSGVDSLLLQNFCIYHINAPGHELGAAAISDESPFLSMDDLADQVAEVFDFFGVKKAICLGVLAGAYVISLFAIKYRERVTGLILVSPLCRAPSWTEWLYNKELLLLRYFSEEVRCGVEGAKSDVLQTCRRLLDDGQRSNLIRFLIALNGRWDLSANLKDLQCKTLIFAGSNSPFYSEALHMNKMMGCTITDLVEIHGCGSLVTEEQPEAMLAPLELFLESFGAFRQACSLGPIPPTAHIPPEFLSVEAIGIKLKPIKTRA